VYCSISLLYFHSFPTRRSSDLVLLLVQVGLQLVDLALEVFLGALARLALIQRALQVDGGEPKFLGPHGRSREQQQRKQDDPSLHSYLLERRVPGRGYNGAPKENWKTLLRSPFFLS